MAHVRELLKDKNFFLLWFAQIVSNFGDRLNQMALIGLIYIRTPGSTLELAKLLSFTILPVFIIGPIAGIYVDRWNRKATMITCDLIRGGLVLLIPLIIKYSTSMVPIYVVVFIIFSVTRFFVPSKMSIIPDIVHKDKLLLANSLSSTTMMIATIVSFGFSGVIVAAFGPQAGFFIDSASYFISAGMVFFVAIKLKENITSATGQGLKLAGIARKTVIGDIKEGLAYLRSHGDIKMVANTMFLLMAGVGSIYIVIIVFVQEALRSSTKHLGLLVMFLGAGLFLGSLVYGKFGSRFSKKKVINFGLLTAGLTIVLFTICLKLAPSFFMAGLLSTVLGIFSAPIIVSSNTLLYEVMHDDMRGRIFSSLEIIMHAGFLLFMFLASVAADEIGRDWVLMGIGILFSIIGLEKLVRLRREGNEA
ncbi:MAG: MFS transporter [Candidatus Omnitrophota bacterium]|nr:MFS transporter [Candidatus Omnitrophota bacterium]